MPRAEVAAARASPANRRRSWRRTCLNSACAREREASRTSRPKMRTSGLSARAEPMASSRRGTQRIQELRPDLERTDARGNAERHGHAADARQPRIPGEQTGGELQVERES